jgi:hypothetical protein
MQQLLRLIEVNYENYKNKLHNRKDINGRITFFVTIMMIIMVVSVVIIKMYFFKKIVKYLKYKKII